MHRRKQVVFSLLMVLAMLLTMAAPALAQDPQPQPLPDGSSRVFVPLASRGAQQAAGALTEAGAPVLESTESVDKVAQVAAATLPADHFREVSIIVVTDPGTDANAIAAGADGQIVHRYTKVFNGVSMVLPSDNVDQVANAQGVQKVFLDTLEQPTTEVSPTFIGAPTAWQHRFMSCQFPRPPPSLLAGVASWELMRSPSGETSRLPVVQLPPLGMQWLT